MGRARSNFPMLVNVRSLGTTRTCGQRYATAIGAIEHQPLIRVFLGSYIGRIETAAG